jgi:hypothetical protein
MKIFGLGISLKLENIEERAPRFIYEDNNSTYENKSKLPSLKIRRFKKKHWC